VNAPFEGTIGLLRVDLGQYVQPGTIIATLQDLSVMRVDFSLAEQSLPDLFIGQTLHLQSDDGQQSFEGEISGIDPRVDPASRLVAVRGTVELSNGALTPGQFVRLRLDLPQEEDVLALPQTAVISSLYGDFVYVVRPQEDDPEALAVRQVFVETGRRSGAMIEVREGLSAGDRVVTTGQNRLSNNAPVTLADAEDEDEPATEEPAAGEPADEEPAAEDATTETPADADQGGDGAAAQEVAE